MNDPDLTPSDQQLIRDMLDKFPPVDISGFNKFVFHGVKLDETVIFTGPPKCPSPSKAR